LIEIIVDFEHFFMDKDIGLSKQKH
jgi:hypothetical protein